MKKYKKYMDGVKAPDTLHQRLMELKKGNKRPTAWKNYGAMAAALALVLGVGGFGYAHYWNTVVNPTGQAFLDATQAFHSESHPDIAIEDPSEAEDGVKMIGSYEYHEHEGVASYRFLPYIEYGDTGGMEMCADWDIPTGAAKKDLSRDEMAALLGGQDVVNTHLDWGNYELTGWAAWYEDGTFWGAYIYGYEGPLDHFEFAVTAGQRPPTCVAFPNSVTQEVWDLTVTASGHDSVAAPQGGVDASARRVDFMRDSYGYGFDITGTSRALTEERVSRLVCCVMDERLALWTVDPNVETYTCPDCGQTVPADKKHRHTPIGAGGESSASTEPYVPAVSANPEDYVCGYPLAPSGRADAAAQEADCGMPDWDKPPTLNIICGSAGINSGSGSYNWRMDLGNGLTSSVIACGAHPLDFWDAPSLTTSADKAKLNFVGTPDRVRVDCWPDSEWGSTSAGRQTAGVEKNELTLGFELSLKEGGWIYELTAEWDDFGTASYVFYITQN